MQRDDDLYVMINAYWEPLSFVIQEGQPNEWRRVIDTSLLSPADCVEPGEGQRLQSPLYEVTPRSVVVLERANRSIGSVEPQPGWEPAPS